MFEDGTKVVCIDDKFSAAVKARYSSLPREGRTYTVRDAVPAMTENLKRTVAILLSELKNPLMKNGKEYAFKPNRFRELDTAPPKKLKKKNTNKIKE